MNSHFLNGFADELTKEAGIPSISGGKRLAQKVLGMLSKKMEQGSIKNFRMKKKAESTAASRYLRQHGAVTGSRLPGESMASPAPYKPAFDMQAPENQPGANVSKTPAPVATPKARNLVAKNDKAKYGGGTGNFEGKQAPPFTDKVNPTDTPKAFGKKASVITQTGRKRLKKSEFALPRPKGAASEGPTGVKKAKGSYPINDIAHARNALARVAQFGSPAEQAAVRAKVYSKYPALAKRSSK